MKNEKQTSNLNFNVQLFWKSENQLFWCFLSQLQYRNENQIFISNFLFQFIKKAKWHFGCTDSKHYRNYIVLTATNHHLLIELNQVCAYKKCPNSVLFWSTFSHIRIEYGEILICIQPECGNMLTRLSQNKDTFCAVPKSSKLNIHKSVKSWKSNTRIEIPMEINIARPTHNIAEVSSKFISIIRKSFKMKSH